MEDNIDSPNYAPTVTFAIRKATIKFINSLNQNQKNKALFSLIQVMKDLNGVMFLSIVMVYYYLK